MSFTDVMKILDVLTLYERAECFGALRRNATVEDARALLEQQHFVAVEQFVSGSDIDNPSRRSLVTQYAEPAPRAPLQLSNGDAASINDGDNPPAAANDAVPALEAPESDEDKQSSLSRRTLLKGLGAAGVTTLLIGSTPSEEEHSK